MKNWWTGHSKIVFASTTFSPVLVRYGACVHTDVMDGSLLSQSLFLEEMSSH